MRGRFEIHPSLNEIAEAGAAEMARVVRTSVAERGRCVVALSGRHGSAAVCRRLAEPPYDAELPWESLWVFATDQRTATTSGAGRPLAQIRDVLERVAVPPEQIFVLDSGSAGDIAASTTAALADVIGDDGLDLALLEMGEHGRVASVYPGTSAVYEQRRGAMAEWVPGVEQWRVTLTLPELSRARQAIVVVVGADKAAVMEDLASRASGVPAARLAGDVLWLVEAAAAPDREPSSGPSAPATASPDAGPDPLKRAAAEAALAEITSGMRIGLGTGSTVRWVVEGLARALADGRLRDIVAVPTSDATAELAGSVGIALTTLEATGQLDLTIDGADEIDPQLDLVKGGGGALLREKIVARSSRRLIVVADDSKLVPHLLSSFALPVEVDPFGWSTHLDALAELGAHAELRRRDGQPARTDGGHYVLDCRFENPPDDLARLDHTLRSRPGVIETGLFLGIAQRAYIAGAGGVEVRTRA